jgi:uncharacterized protein (DUF2147 family)
MKRPLALALLLLIQYILIAQNHTVTGKWQTIDDTTGETKSIVEIFERNGLLYGKILRIFPKPGNEDDPVCDKCAPDDSRYNKKIIGMEILKDMRRNGKEFSQGNILDPEVGKVYKCKIWLEGEDLKVRGYWGPFWRTQTWKRVN